VAIVDRVAAQQGWLLKGEEHIRATPTNLIEYNTISPHNVMR
jgi:hypothetical protein